MQTFVCKNIAAMEAFGKRLAQFVQTFFEKNKTLPFNAIFLRGTLGSGKTTLTRALVQHLPRGLEAEVSSPSFTLCNSYDTQPEILHCDLYRCATALPDELWDALESKHVLCIIEWAEYMPSHALLEDFLDICLEICNTERLVTVSAKGSQACLLLQHCTQTV